MTSFLMHRCSSYQKNEPFLTKSNITACTGETKYLQDEKKVSRQEEEEDEGKGRKDIVKAKW